MARPSTRRPPPRRSPAGREIRRVGAVQFVREVWAELRRCVWPTRQETMRLTYVVILLSVVVGAILGLLDIFLTQTFTRFVIR